MSHTLFQILSLLHVGISHFLWCLYLLALFLVSVSILKQASYYNPGQPFQIAEIFFLSQGDNMTLVLDIP